MHHRLHWNFPFMDCHLELWAMHTFVCLITSLSCLFSKFTPLATSGSVDGARSRRSSAGGEASHLQHMLSHSRRSSNGGLPPVAPAAASNSNSNPGLEPVGPLYEQICPLPTHNPSTEHSHTTCLLIPGDAENEQQPWCQAVW